MCLRIQFGIENTTFKIIDIGVIPLNFSRLKIISYSQNILVDKFPYILYITVDD